MRNQLRIVANSIVCSLLILFPLVLLSLPSFSLAQHFGSDGALSPTGGKSGGSGGSPTAAGSVKLENPMSRFGSFNEFMVGILNVVIILAIPVVVFFIILAGFKYVTARGNAAETQKATAALTYAVIGGVLILGAVTIAEIIKNLVDSFAG